MNSIPLWKFLRESILSNAPCALLLTVETTGSGPGRQGAAMAVTHSGRTRGTAGGGVMEHKLTCRAQRMLENGITSPELVIYDHMNGNDHIGKGTPSGMICSGSQTTAVFPMHRDMLETLDLIISILENRGTGTLSLSSTGLTVSDFSAQETDHFSMTGMNDWEYRGTLGIQDTVYVIGGGHVGRELVNLLQRLSFHSVIIDERRRDSFEDPASCRWITAPYSEAHSYIPDGCRSWVVIMTPFHGADAEVLKSLCAKNLKYVGMMASSSKKSKIYSELIHSGVSEEFLNSVYCPVGFSIGSRTPGEIAVSIAAQLIKVRSVKIGVVS
ncbi:MAG: XdhC family protein [Candidatus Fermentibacteria bacterium]